MFWKRAWRSAAAAVAAGVFTSASASAWAPPVKGEEAGKAEVRDGGKLSPTSEARERSRVYRLEADSAYRNACFDPCDCATDIRSSLSGTMVLTRVAPVIRGTRRYEVNDVNWRVVVGGSDVLVRGRGVYTWYPSLGPLTVLAHRLELELRVGEGAEPIRFDSEVVAGASDGFFPPIRITIDMNNQVCYDQVFTINATPVVPSSIVGYRLDGDSFYQQGCLPPCLCPIWAEMPIGGRMSLVPLPSTPDEPAVRQWGVIDVRWSPTASVSSVNAVATGSGFYRLTPTNAEPYSQRMLVALTRPTIAEKEFDSGWVGVGPSITPGLPPRNIDVMIADNDFFCFNEVFNVSAGR